MFIKSPDHSVEGILKTSKETLKSNQNVLFPVYPSGVVFDLLEILSLQLEQSGLGSVPFYYIAPLAKESLAHAQIFPECLSEPKQSRATNPEFPFIHEELLETGKLKVFEHSADGLSDHFKGPAVIFSGHPTLEMGESRDLCSKWLESDQHKIIITEPDLPPTIFQDRRSTVLYWPIDTRLTQSAARMLIEELEPKEVIISDIMRKNCPTLAESGSVNLPLKAPKLYL